MKQEMDCHRPSGVEVGSKWVSLKKAGALTANYAALTVTGLHISGYRLMTGLGQVKSFPRKVDKAMALKRVRMWIFFFLPPFFHVRFLNILYKQDTEAVFRAKWTIALFLNGNRHISSFRLFRV